MASKILYSREKIKAAIESLQSQIQETRMSLRATLPLTVIGNLNGCLFFMADLLRGEIPADQIGFCQTSAYEELYPEAHQVRSMIKMKPSVQFENHHVIIVDDVLDTGLSLQLLVDFCKYGGRAAFVETCVLLEKPARKRAAIQPTYVGFPDCPDVFVYGYGMDYQGKMRELSDIWMASEEEVKAIKGVRP